MKAGATHLEAIATEKFAFQPNALIALRRISKHLPADKLAKIEEVLNRNYFDSYEWLLQTARTIKDEDWAAFRKRQLAKE